MIDRPEELMALVERAAEMRPDPDDHLREIGIDPAIMADFHLLDLRDTLHTLFEGRSGTDPMTMPVALSIQQVAAIVAAHGTVLLQFGYQLGRGDVAA